MVTQRTVTYPRDAQHVRWVHLLVGSIATLTLLALVPRAPRADEFLIHAKRMVLRIKACDFGDTARGRVYIRALPKRLPAADPAVAGSALQIRGSGEFAVGTESISLDASRWITLKGGRGYRYADRDGSAGGVKRVVLTRRKLLVKAGGSHFAWLYAPNKAVTSLSARVEVGGEAFVMTERGRPLRGSRVRFPPKTGCQDEIGTIPSY